MASVDFDISKHMASAFAHSMTLLDVERIRSEGRSTEVLRTLVETAQTCLNTGGGPIPLPLGNMEVIAKQRYGECVGCLWHPSVCKHCLNGI